MKLPVDTILNTLEPHFTKVGKRRRLKTTEAFSLRLYLRTTLNTMLPVVGLVVLGWVAPLAYLWHRYPIFSHQAVFHHGKAHALLIGLLAREGYYQLPLVLTGLLMFNLMLWWPHYYFWNRRASRLRHEAQNHLAAPQEVATVDTSVWPPAPDRP